MNLLEVYNLQYQKLAILNDKTVGSAKNIQEQHNTNQISELTFEMPLSSDKWQYVVNENLVKWKGEYYFVKNPNFEHSKNKKNVKVKCSHLSCSLENNVVTEVVAVGWSAKVLMKFALGYKALYDTNGVFTGYFDEGVATTTGWYVGNVNLSKEVLRSVEVKEQSAFSTLVRIAETFFAYLTFNSVSRTVDLSDIPFNRNIQIRIKKNLKSVNVSYDSTELVTVMYPYGGTDKDIGEVSILGAVDADEKEVTKSYLEDYSWFFAKEPTLTSDYIVAHPELFYRELTWREGLTTDPQVLYDEAIKKMDIVSKPKIKCNIQGVDLSIFPDYFIQSPMLNEIITVIDEELNLSFDTQVIGISKNEDNPLEMNIQTSNEIIYDGTFKKIVDTSAKIQRTLTPIGEVKSDFLKGVINLMKTKLGSTESNYSGVCSDEHGNLLIENTTKTKAMKIGGGIFAIASQRLADGTDYDWQTFGDGDGFVASLITAGTLVGGKMQFNLDDGTFLIGSSTTDYLMYFDGTTLKLGKGSAISWGDNYIDEDGVYTGEVLASSVIAGTLEGCLLKTTPATQNGSYIKIYEKYIDFVYYNTTTQQYQSLFQIGIDMPNAETGKPQLFFNNGCSVDTYGGSLRMRNSNTNYIRIDDGDVMYVYNGVEKSMTSGGTIPVFG